MIFLSGEHIVENLSFPLEHCPLDIPMSKQM